MCQLAQSLDHIGVFLDGIAALGSEPWITFTVIIVYASAIKFAQQGLVEIQAMAEVSTNIAVEGRGDQTDIHLTRETIQHSQCLLQKLNIVVAERLGRM